MNCTEVRQQLPLHLYGDLPPDAVQAIELHLADCPVCAAERQALAQVQSALSTAPAPPCVEIDVRRLYAELHLAEQRRTRRWKRAAGFIAATAAGLACLVLATRVELRVEEHQLVVRWGAPPAVMAGSPRLQPESPAVSTDRAEPRVIRTVEDQLLVLSKIIHTMARDTANRDGDYERDLAWLKGRVHEMQRQMDRRFLDTEKDLRTLYKWQFVRNDKGELQ